MTDNRTHITLDEQIEVDQALLEIQRDIDQIVQKVYLMGYNKGLLHSQNTPYFP